MAALIATESGFASTEMVNINKADAGALMEKLTWHRRSKSRKAIVDHCNKRMEASNVQKT